MIWDCLGWEIGNDLGTGASVTGSRVVVSTAGVSVASSSSDESRASIRTLSLSWFDSDKEATEDDGKSGVEVENPKGSWGASVKIRPSAVWKSCPGWRLALTANNLPSACWTREGEWARDGGRGWERREWSLLAWVWCLWTADLESWTEWELWETEPRGDRWAWEAWWTRAESRNSTWGSGRGAAEMDGRISKQHVRKNWQIMKQ